MRKRSEGNPCAGGVSAGRRPTLGVDSVASLAILGASLCLLTHADKRDILSKLGVLRDGACDGRMDYHILCALDAQQLEPMFFHTVPNVDSESSSMGR